MNIKTFVFIDLETTGLRNYKHEAKITEMCLVAVNRCHLMSNFPQQIPRILNKLNLCFYPQKQISPYASKLTGLCNDSLKNIQPFSILSYELIDKFLKHQESPVCLVAHNGFKFDYMVLNDQLQQLGKKLPDDILCMDTLPAFRHIFTSPPIKTEQNEENLNISPNSKIINIIKQQQIINESTPKNTATTSNNIKFNPKKIKYDVNDAVDASVPCNSKATRKLDYNKEKPISYKLVDIYKFIFKQDMPTAHQAEYDVFALMKCCSEVHNPFFEYADNNCKSLNDFYSD
ncbi:uncharacterized protein LOC123295947 [Chrysoperla carnea]|uniref:uncharacterized protein LOC123295947 n=1 Tax=Chrysoperla carnea TaxID=189513 RepID=UPI001D06D0A8|nr:uncharacterized protein LOC123295947 [Chrysoperla carnea]